MNALLTVCIVALQWSSVSAFVPHTTDHRGVTTLAVAKDPPPLFGT